MASDGGKMTAHSCKTFDNQNGYFNNGGVMELLYCSSDDDIRGCYFRSGHLTATNVAVTDSIDGFHVEGGNAELRSCSVRDSHKLGMLFGFITPRYITPGSEPPEARVQDCTVAQNGNGGFVHRQVHRWPVSYTHLTLPTNREV